MEGIELIWLAPAYTLLVVLSKPILPLTPKKKRPGSWPGLCEYAEMFRSGYFLMRPNSIA